MQITRRHILLGSVLSIMLAPETGGGSGGSANPPGTLEEQLTAARNDLTTARASIASVTTERDTARSELATAQTEVTRLTNQFTTLTTTASASAAEVTRLTSELSTVTAARDTVTRDLTTANTNITRLEALCGVQGIDSKKIPAAIPEPGAKSSMAEWSAKIDAAKTPADKAKLTAAFEKAYAAGEVVG